jgi:hypothetical protein
MMASVPFSAPGTPPDTGASTKPMPFAARRRANCCADAGAMLEKSTTTRGGLAPSAKPRGPKITSSAARWSVTHIITISAARATSDGDCAARAPFASTAASFSRLRFQTATSWPAASRRSVMGWPIRPIPMNPSFIAFCRA